MNLFGPEELETYIKKFESDAAKKIKNMTGNALRTCDVGSFRIETMDLDLENIVKESPQKKDFYYDEIPKKFRAGRWEDEKITRNVYRFSIRITGNHDLSRYYPGNKLNRVFDVALSGLRLEGRHICFDIVNWTGNQDDVLQSYKEIKKTLRNLCNQANQQVLHHNDSMLQRLTRILEERRVEEQKERDFLDRIDDD